MKEIPNNGGCVAESDKFGWYGINQYTTKDIYKMLDEIDEGEEALCRFLSSLFKKDKADDRKILQEQQESLLKTHDLSFLG